MKLKLFYSTGIAGGFVLLKRTKINPSALAEGLSAQTRNRTKDTRIFSPLLYQLSYLGILGMCPRPESNRYECYLAGF